MLGYMEATKRRNILWDCDCDIKLLQNPQREILTGSDTIQGLVIINPLTAKSGNFACVRIQLEGHTTTRFQTKIDNRVTNHLKDYRFLPDSSPDDDSLCTYLIGKKTVVEKDRRWLPRGTHSFPFKIQLSGQQFPASFQSPFGRIQFKLVVYAIQHDRHEIPAAEKTLATKGNLNLSLDPSLSQRLVVTKKKDKSFFSKRTILKVSLNLCRRGFLPDEDVNFSLQLENPTCETISRIHVALVQKLVYFANKVSKTTRGVLEEQENGCDSSDGQIEWTTALHVPPNLMPTFNHPRKSLEIIYCVEFVVEILGKPQMKGETEIVIGTLRDEEGSTSSSGSSSGSSSASSSASKNKVPNSNSNSTLAGVGGSVERARRESLDSNWSIQTCSTLPPNYSTLSSRRPSLETLPPSYGEVVGDENWEDTDNEEFRPRCSSNSM